MIPWCIVLHKRSKIFVQFLREEKNYKWNQFHDLVGFFFHFLFPHLRNVLTILGSVNPFSCQRPSLNGSKCCSGQVHHNNYKTIHTISLLKQKKNSCSYFSSRLSDIENCHCWRCLTCNPRNEQFERRMQVHFALILGDIKSKGTSVKIVNKI